jgi:HAD superfamily hydrolase (TIGR01509 family)
LESLTGPVGDDLLVHDLQLVIFDCDGVLVDSEVISNRVLARLLTAEGLPTTLVQARRECQGLLMDEVFERAQEKLGRALAPDLPSRFESERAAAFERELEPIGGAAEAVEQVSAAGVAVCVASQGKLEKTRLSLELTGLRRLFSERALFSAHTVGRGKPHPDLFLHAAAEMGADPVHCTVVEDTPSGVMAGVSAGMRVFGYAADSDETALRRAGATTFDSLEQLPELLALSSLDRSSELLARPPRS